MIIIIFYGGILLPYMQDKMYQHFDNFVNMQLISGMSSCNMIMLICNLIQK